MNMLETPVLLLAFNRPELTRIVFRAIRSVRPKKLYIAIDGPRMQSDDFSAIAEVQKIVAYVDWDCQVYRLYQKNNLGCKKGVSTAIDWFFKNEEEGIVLEDDCEPTLDFFYFAQEMLSRYRDDPRVMMITGSNHLAHTNKYPPYFFSEHYHIWGWATWRRAWSLYDVNMSGWELEENKAYVKNKFCESYIAKHFENTFDSLKTFYVDTWDIQWVFTCLSNGGLCLTPGVNMISNIGVLGSHAGGVTDSHFMPTNEMPKSIYDTYFPAVRVLYDFDVMLHNLKSKPSVRKRRLINALVQLGVYKYLKKIKHLIGRK